MNEPETAIAIWNVINTTGVIGLLILNLVLLLRGAVLPRKVYEELTSRILEELCNRVIEGVREVIREEAKHSKGED